MDWIFEWNVHLIVRMLTACICGIAIGFERKNRSKEAGVRTHCIVACASALMMILSKYSFADVLDGSIYGDAEIKLDPSRLAQGIITGVGFIGSGIIFVQRNLIIKGLTTAAGLWATCGIGMAIGSGMYILGFSATVIILLAQIILHKKNWFMVAHKAKELHVNGVDRQNFQRTFENALAEQKILVNDVSVSTKDQKLYNYVFYIEVPNKIVEEDLIQNELLQGYEVILD